MGNENIKTYFDEISNEYSHAYDRGKINTVRAYIFQLRKDKVFSIFNKSGGRVLDAGCGPGIYADELLSMGCEIWGIDISEAMIDLAKKRISDNKDSTKANFKVGDILSIDLPDEYFDCVLCVGVLEYLKDDSLALKEIYRVLKHKGEAIFSVPNFASPFLLIDNMALLIARFFINILRMKRTKYYLLSQGGFNSKYYLPWRLDTLLVKNGFEINKRIFHVYRLALLNAVSAQLSLAFSRKLEMLSKTLFQWIGINYIVKVHKV